MNNKILKKGLSIFTLFLAILPIILTIFCFVFVDSTEFPQVLNAGQLNFVNDELTGSGVSGMVLEYLNIGENNLLIGCFKFLVENVFLPCNLCSLYLLYCIYIYMFAEIIELICNVVFAVPHLINRWFGRFAE